MNKTRWALGFAAAVVGLGVLVGALAWIASERVEAQSSDSTLALDWVPGSADIVGQLDVSALASSPLADAWKSVDSSAAEGAAGEELPDVPDIDGIDSIDGIDALREATGIDWKRDVKLFTLSSEPSDGSARRAHRAHRAHRDRFGVVLRGRFDPEELVKRLRERRTDLEEETYRGTTLYPLKHVGPREAETPMALAIPDASTVLIGQADYLRKMLDAGGGFTESIRSSVETWGFGSFAGQTFWVAGAPEDLLGSMTKEAGLPGSAGPSGPAALAGNLRAFAISGRLDADLALRARGRARDPQAAKEITEVLTGLVALGKLQGGRDSTSALAALADAVQIDQLESEIDVNLTVPYETVEKLLDAQKRRERGSP